MLDTQLKIKYKQCENKIALVELGIYTFNTYTVKLTVVAAVEWETLDETRVNHTGESGVEPHFDNLCQSPYRYH